MMRTVTIHFLPFTANGSLITPITFTHSLRSREFGIVATKIPDPPILAFFDFLAFFVFRFPLLFLGVFLGFSKDFRGSAKRKTLVFFGVSLAFSKRARVGGAGISTRNQK